jgi:hypothetical protein
MRARRADADFEEIEDADRHACATGNVGANGRPTAASVLSRK